VLLDNQAIFSNAQAITASAGSTDSIKFGGEVAFGTPIPTIFQVVEDFEGGTSVALSIQTTTVDDTDYSEAVTLVSTAAIAVASLVKGYTFPIREIPKGNLGMMRAYYTVVGTPTAGKITGGVVAARDEGYQDIPVAASGS
jgi:hypothetical protein